MVKDVPSSSQQWILLATLTGYQAAINRSRNIEEETEMGREAGKIKGGM